MGMKRLIDDKRRKFIIWTLSITVLIMAISSYSWNKISSLNEQKRSKGREVLNALHEKHAWLSTILESPLHDADDLEKKIGQINTLIKAKDKTIISNHHLFPISNKKAEALANECEEIIDELSNVKNQLSSLSMEGANMVPHLRNWAHSQTVTEIKAIYDNTENAYTRLEQICSRQFISSKVLNNSIDDCNDVIKEIEAYQFNKTQWKQFEKKHETYIVWGKTVSELLNHYNQLDNKLQDIHQKMKSLQLDHEEIKEIAQKQINDKRNAIESLVENGTDLCDNSCIRLEQDLSKLQSTAQIIIDSISKLQDLHGGYVDAANVTSAIQKYESFKEFCQNSCKNVNVQCITIRKSIEDLKLSLNTTSASFNFLLNMDNSISDKLVLQKYQESQERIQKLQSHREELEKELKTLKDYMTQVKSSANETVKEIKAWAMNIQQSFPDWTSEGRKMSNEIADILHDARRIRAKYENITKECLRYHHNRNQGVLKSLQEKRDAIFEILAKIETHHISGQNVSNGRELIELKQRRDEMKRMYEMASQKEHEFSIEYNNALEAGLLRKINYIPYSKSLSIASQLQEGKRHFDYSLEIPTKGNHKIVIIFKKDRRALYYSKSDLRKHQIIANCIITGSKIKTVPAWSWTDSQNPWKKEIEFEGDFPQGKIDINLDLTFKAVYSKEKTLYDGIWQFQYDVPNSKLKQDNFAIEIMLDGNPVEILVRQ